MCVCVFDIDVVQKASKNCLVCKKLPFPNALFVYSSFFWHVHGVHGPCITTTAILPWFVAAKLKGWNQQLQRTFWSFNAQFHNCQLGSVLSKSTSFQLQSKFQIKTMGGRKSKSSFCEECFSKKTTFHWSTANSFCFIGTHGIAHLIAEEAISCNSPKYPVVPKAPANSSFSLSASSSCISLRVWR